jgi:hypothetical protein
MGPIGFASQGNSSEFYNTTPFQFDRSAEALSTSFIVTTTVMEPAANRADESTPIAPAPNAPPLLPPAESARFSD